MPHNENSRVKIPALVHFTRLGYKYISLRKYEGVIDDDTNILVDVFCDAINRINATSLTTTDMCINTYIINWLWAKHPFISRSNFPNMIHAYLLRIICHGQSSSVLQLQTRYKKDK